MKRVEVGEEQQSKCLSQGAKGLTDVTEQMDLWLWDFLVFYRVVFKKSCNLQANEKLSQRI